jgi:hypothetical protein
MNEKYVKSSTELIVYQKGVYDRSMKRYNILPDVTAELSMEQEMFF